MNKTVLCVDDDSDVLSVLKAVLESRGYQVSTAKSAAEGLKLFTEQRPSLVLVDLMMETVDAGLGFVEKARAVDGAVPLYLLSSTGADLRRNFDPAAIGCAGILEKPVDPERLLALVSARLGA